MSVLAEQREVQIEGKPVELTPKEFELLLFLCRHRGKVLSRQQLLHGVWDYHFLGDTRIVDVHISHLRDKIEKNARTPEYIMTVRNVGYKLTGPNIADSSIGLDRFTDTFTIEDRPSFMQWEGGLYFKQIQPNYPLRFWKSCHKFSQCFAAFKRNRIICRSTKAAYTAMTLQPDKPLLSPIPWRTASPAPPIEYGK